MLHWKRLIPSGTRNGSSTRRTAREPSEEKGFSVKWMAGTIQIKVTLKNSEGGTEKGQPIETLAGFGCEDGARRATRAL